MIDMMMVLVLVFAAMSFVMEMPYNLVACDQMKKLETAGKNFHFEKRNKNFEKFGSREYRSGWARRVNSRSEEGT